MVIVYLVLFVASVFMAGKAILLMVKPNGSTDFDRALDAVQYAAAGFGLSVMALLFALVTR